jgi:hypothetical protein
VKAAALRWNVAGSLAALMTVAAPSIAFACPVCFAAKDEANRVAFLGTTVFLTSLPVLMISSLIYWVARRSHALDSEIGEQGDRDGLEAPPGAPAVARQAEPGAAPEASRGELIPLRRGR